MPADLHDLPALRLERHRRAGVDIPEPVEGVWRAHIPLGPNSERVLAGHTARELADKLDRAAAGG